MICNKCFNENSLGRQFRLYFGPDLGDHQYTERRGNATITTTVKGRQLDGIADVFICNRCCNRHISEQLINDVENSGSVVSIFSFLITIVLLFARLFYVENLKHKGIVVDNYSFLITTPFCVLAPIAISGIIFGIFYLRKKKLQQKLTSLTDAELEEEIVKREKAWWGWGVFSFDNEETPQKFQHWCTDLAANLHADTFTGEKTPAKYRYFYLTEEQYKLLR